MPGLLPKTATESANSATVNSAKATAPMARRGPAAAGTPKCRTTPRQMNQAAVSINGSSTITAINSPSLGTSMVTRRVPSTNPSVKTSAK